MHCACICIRFNPDTFSIERSPNYDTRQVYVIGYIMGVLKYGIDMHKYRLFDIVKCLSIET
jgi:hypothetical protein